MSLKVIVTIPVYNGETTIKDALLSAINQSVEPDSIIISDNNSTDKTRDIVNEIISENTEIDIKLYKNITNIGYHKNLNKCLEYSKGYNYLVILYADDVLKRNMIKEQLDFLTGHSEFGLVGSKEDVIDDSLIKDKFLSMLQLQHNTLPIHRLCMTEKNWKRLVYMLQIQFFQMNYLICVCYKNFPLE